MLERIPSRVNQRSHLSRKPTSQFDLDKFDRPEEFLFIPFLNNFTRFVDNQDGNPLDVYTQVGDDTITYRMEAEDDGVRVFGDSNGQDFSLNLNGHSSTLAGHLGGDAVEVSLQSSFEKDEFVLTQKGLIGKLGLQETIRFKENSTVSSGAYGAVKHESKVNENLLWTGKIGKTQYQQQLIPFDGGVLAVGTIGGEQLLQWALKVKETGVRRSPFG
jgi:hypothetical protein